MDRPPFVALRLTDPRMEATVCRWLQEVMNRSEHVWPKLLVDGKFGPHTAQEAEALLYRLGHPNPREAVSIADLAVLWEWTRTNELPAEWRQRRLSRMAAKFGRDRGITVRSWLGLHPVPTDKNTDDLVVISRDRAGLRPPESRQSVPYSANGGAVVHWMGPGRGAVGLEASFAQLRGFQRFHMDAHGWSDIGYTVAIPRGVEVGTVVDLRGVGIRGAHSGHNVANALPGILLMFGDQDGTPTPDQLRTLAMWLGEHARGRLTGHLEWSPTSCPGTALYGWVKANR